jgi:hypothetical protein
MKLLAETVPRVAKMLHSTDNEGEGLSDHHDERAQEPAKASSLIGLVQTHPLHVPRVRWILIKCVPCTREFRLSSVSLVQWKRPLESSL